VSWGAQVAIKKFKESDEDEQVKKTALREIRILKVRSYLPCSWPHAVLMCRVRLIRAVYSN
jgi:hypothetical protein